MKTNHEQFAVRLLSLAVHGALGAMFALPLVAAAEDSAEVLSLTQPTNFVEVGAENVSSTSAKFGEYNGLNKSGAEFIGNFSVRGGDAYHGADGITRWELRGTDLGTTSRELSATVSQQGRWTLGIGYDELRHHITDTYQTPYPGSSGGNSFILPPSFGVIDATPDSPAGVGTQSLTAAQQAAFHTEDVYTSRKNTSFNAGYIISREWSVQFDYNRLDQSGSKLIGASFSPDASGAGIGETSATLMNPTNYKTDTFDLAVNWVGDQGHFKASYFASIFKDGYSSFSWSNPFEDNGGGTNGNAPANGTFPVNTFATAPNNYFHQLNLSGGYDITPTTKLAGGLSYGRNAQNASFIEDPLFTATLPQSSLNGLVVTTHADLRLTNQTTKDLGLSASLKYNERDNRTPSSTYESFVSVAGDPWGPIVNAPVSNRKTQLEFGGNYRIDKKQTLNVAYEYEAIKRWCNNSLANEAQSTDVLANVPGYYTTSACVQSPESKESKLSANYRVKASATVKLNAGYSYAKRRADINSSYYNPMQARADGLQNLGYVPYFDASRTEQLVKGGVNWQASDALNFSLNGRYVDDKYDAALGVQKGSKWGLNLDSTYAYSQDGSVSAYVSVQRRQRDLLSSEDHSPLAAPVSIWSNRLADDNDTLGLTARQKGLMSGRLELIGDVSYSLGKTQYSTQLENYTTAECNAGITCGSLPDIKNEMLRLRITGIYQINRASKVALSYRFQKLKSDDYYYSAYQMGYTDVMVIPTNQQAPNYSVNLITASYIYTF